MMRNKYKRPLLAILFTAYSMTLLCQEKSIVQVTPRNSAVKIFLDCNRCDMNYTRENIPFVNYVRDVKEAEVYILVTGQRAGSGGDQFTYKFQGQGRFMGFNDTLTYTTSPDQTSMTTREKITNMLKIGLMRYVAKTPMVDDIDIQHRDAIETEEILDGWNNWVFQLQTSPRFNMEEAYRRVDFSNSFEISKVTPDLKFEIDVRQNLNRQRFIEEDSDTTYIRSSESLSNLIVMSLSNHWSAGLRWGVSASTWENYDLNVNFMPAVEYNLYPYSESTHRQLRFQYSIGLQYSNYTDTTLFYKTRETLYRQNLNVAFQVQEKWGSVNLSLGGSNFLHDFSYNRIELNSFVRVRVLKGLSLSVNGGAGYINNRLNLAKGSLSEAERLLRLKQQATKYELSGGLTITYIFGSIFNNVVNPRFGGGY